MSKSIDTRNIKEILSEELSKELEDINEQIIKLCIDNETFDISELNHEEIFKLYTSITRFFGNNHEIYLDYMIKHSGHSRDEYFAKSIIRICNKNLDLFRKFLDYVVAENPNYKIKLDHFVNIDDLSMEKMFEILYEYYQIHNIKIIPPDLQKCAEHHIFIKLVYKYFGHSHDFSKQNYCGFSTKVPNGLLHFMDSNTDDCVIDAWTDVYYEHELPCISGIDYLHRSANIRAISRIKELEEQVKNLNKTIEDLKLTINDIVKTN